MDNDTLATQLSVREFAETILFSDRLADKLIIVDRFADHAPGTAIATPRFPARPREIDLELARQRTKVPFPTLRDLEHERYRGYVMHFFANHELLALELMALVLLRFPDAPTSFRRGIVQTMQEEQTHMRLYLERMREAGVEFGEIPVNDFFWTCIADMRDPLDFVARMSLTFEQANLDYSLYYQKAFATLGDERTREILDTVYEDELGHVKHGLVWFDRWRDPRETEWESYVKHLAFPLSPARAKGIEFDVETRRAIGFSEEFITRLELFSQSKGRPPRVFLFDPAVESFLAEEGRTYNPPASIERLRRDYGLLPVFLAAADDVVLVEQRPRDTFLLELRRAGFELPEIVELADGKIRDELMQTRHLGTLEPWGWSARTERWLEPLFGRLATPVDPRRVRAAARPLFSKAWALERLRALLDELPSSDWLADTGTIGRHCTSLAEARAAIAALVEAGGAALVKAPFGASGRENFRFECADEIPARRLGWLERTLAAQGGVVVERYLDRVLDGSFQLHVLDDGTLAVKGFTRFVTSAGGQYRASVVGRWADDLDEELRRFLYGRGSSRRPRMSEVEQAVAENVGRAAAAAGYRGPIGVDMLVYRDATSAEGFRIKPIVEVNPRWTMGRIAWTFQKHLAAGRVAAWLHLLRGEVERFGFASLAMFEQAIRAVLPLQLDPRGGRILEGSIFTTDPLEAQQFVSLLVAGASLEALDERLDQAHPGLGTALLAFRGGPPR